MSNKVILISIDGMRPDGLKQCNNSYVEKLTKIASYTFDARTVYPPVTLPCHFSMFFSVPRKEMVLQRIHMYLRYVQSMVCLNS
jgi:predicted AlkP superfamily phosphohydrolase/phosphomutase